MARYRKKPVIIEAIRHDGSKNSMAAILRLSPAISILPLESQMYAFAIKTLEGTMTAQPGDWVIRGVANEVYPCKHDIFQAIYEPVEEGP